MVTDTSQPSRFAQNATSEPWQRMCDVHHGSDMLISCYAGKTEPRCRADGDWHEPTRLDRIACRLQQCTHWRQTSWAALPVGPVQSAWCGKHWSGNICIRKHMHVGTCVMRTKCMQNTCTPIRLFNAVGPHCLNAVFLFRMPDTVSSEPVKCIESI